jgi:2-dehydropantoate 2-reductase
MNGLPRLTIVGTGAMACLFAGRLAPHAQVTMLGTWQQGLAALKTEGVRLREPDGAEQVFPVHATQDPSQCCEEAPALVLVKSWQTARAATQLSTVLHPDGVALTLQNGLGNREQLEAQLGRSRVAQGVTSSGATLLGPGHVRASGDGPIQLGQHDRLGALTALLRQGGFRVQTDQDVEELLWGKLVINSGINPLTALLNVPNGALLELSDARQLMAHVAMETARVALAKGIHLPSQDPTAAIADVARRTAANRSSMLQDMDRGAPTEIDAINGSIAAEGDRLGLPTPLNQTLWRLVRAAVSAQKGEFV